MLAYRGDVNDENPQTPEHPQAPEHPTDLSEAAASSDDQPIAVGADVDDAADDGADAAGATAEADAAGAIPSAHPVLVYTALRLAVLAVVGGILWLVGLRGVYLILLAFLVSGVISAVALSRRREGAAYGITRVVSSANARLDASSRAEDIDDSDDFDAPTTPDPRP